MISGDIHVFKHLPILDLLLLYAHACQVMFAELNLPVEFFGVVDLHGKPLKAISMVYLDIRERLAQFLLSVDPVNFTSAPEIIIEVVDTGFGNTEIVECIHTSVPASYLNK
jgi:hypothetical protein